MLIFFLFSREVLAVAADVCWVGGEVSYASTSAKNLVTKATPLDKLSVTHQEHLDEIIIGYAFYVLLVTFIY